MPFSRLSVAPVALLAIVLAACGSGSGPTAAPGGATSAPGGQTQPAPTQPTGNGGGGGSFPCAAIQADVVAAVGKTLSKTDFTEADHCEYDFGGTTDLAGIDGVINVRKEADSTDLSSVKLAFSGGDDVSGLGDAAYWAKGVSVMYAVFHGKTYAIQLVLFGTTSDTKAVATTIMQALLAHV